LSNFISYLFSSSALTMRKSPKKQQSQFQIRTVTSESVAQGNGNINIFWKGSRWFFRQCLRIFFIFYDQSKKWLFGKLYLCPSIWTQTSSKFQPNKWFALVQVLPVAVLAIPANSADRANHEMSAKHTVDSHVFFLTCKSFVLTQMQRCDWNPFVQISSMTSSTKTPLTF